MTGPANTQPAEAAIDPGQPIIDAHHHLYDRPGTRYLAEDFAIDLAAGHDVQATVLVQARAFYRTDGPEALRPVGETEAAARVGTLAAGRGGPRLCAAIVGHADLTAGDAVGEVLEAHVAAGAGRFRGIRHILAWDPDPRLLNPAYPTSEDLTATAGFLRGFARLADFGLRFDAWVYFHQLPRIAALARRFPDIPVVLDHCGGVLGTGAYAGRRNEVFTAWRRGLSELAECPNVAIKLGGLGMAVSGFGFDTAPARPTSRALAEAWRPWIRECIEMFGPSRCMFESNAPADRISYGYVEGWNAFKIVVSDLTADERQALFFGTAARVYAI